LKIALLILGFLSISLLNAMHKVEIAKQSALAVDGVRVAQRNAAVEKIADTLLQSGAGEKLRAAVSRQVESATGDTKLIEQGLKEFFIAWGEGWHDKIPLLSPEIPAMKKHITDVTLAVLQRFATSGELLLNVVEFDEIIRCIQLNLCEDSAALAYACLEVVKKSQQSWCNALYYYSKRLAAVTLVSGSIVYMALF